MLDAQGYNYPRFDEYVSDGGEAREFGAFANGLHVGQQAPDFDVMRLDDGPGFPISDL